MDRVACFVAMNGYMSHYQFYPVEVCLASPVNTVSFQVEHSPEFWSRVSHPKRCQAHARQKGLTFPPTHTGVPAERVPDKIIRTYRRLLSTLNRDSEDETRIGIATRAVEEKHYLETVCGLVGVVNLHRFLPSHARLVQGWDDPALLATTHLDHYPLSKRTECCTVVARLSMHYIDRLLKHIPLPPGVPPWKGVVAKRKRDKQSPIPVKKRIWEFVVEHWEATNN